MTRISLHNIAHDKIRTRLPHGGIAIDATAGNGHDTLFLAKHVGPGGWVYGFDIQQTALEITRNRLRQNHLHEHVQLVLESHTAMVGHIANKHRGTIHAIMFNLGYLPGADKTIITRPMTTSKAVLAALKLLAPTGRLTLMIYPGHTGGLLEAETVTALLKNLDQKQVQIERISSQPENTDAPFLYIITRMTPGPLTFS